MKRNTTNYLMQGCLAATLLLGTGAAVNLQAAAPPLNAHLTTRALTPQEIKDYKLGSAQVASGMATIGIGQPAYLEALVNIGIEPTNIVDVVWNLSTQPVGSTATLLPSPLGPNVPTFKMEERLSHRVAGRTFFRPDVEGQYVVSATVTTTDSGTTNLTQKITASTYMGAKNCALCHSGGIGAPNTFAGWDKTAHAHAFERAIDGISTDHFMERCISCHVVGFDTFTNAINGGFDDIAKLTGWMFPTNHGSSNWMAMPQALKDVSNIQCENCHGPGKEHAMALGQTNVLNWPRISTTYASGSCSQCHDSLTHHYRTAEWSNSKHAISVEETEPGCARCHSAKGFARFTSGLTAVATPYDTITCAACHDPHDAKNPHQLRGVTSVALMDKKTVVTEGGLGLMCMNCHITRRDATNYVEVTAGSARFGPHYGAQTDMLVGANAITYGKVIPSSAHKDVVEDSCVTCHMQTVTSTNAAFTKVGGHTFSLTYEGTNGPVHLTGACVECHGEVEDFNFARQDYDGDGQIQGVQTEVKHLMAKLAYLLPPVGVAKDNISINNTWNKQQLKGGYNYLFVKYDGSYGVHNVSYAVGLLKASIADLTGDANNDGLADWWQIKYFGTVSNPNAAPNASPAGDGVPNWLKYGLQLDPFTAGVVLPDGVIYANGGTVGGTNNTVQIYTAAEIVYNTEVGKTYQLQAISSLDGGWKNVGGPVTGTGQAMSLVTPTRGNQQQFYRVQASQ